MLGTTLEALALKDPILAHVFDGVLSLNNIDSWPKLPGKLPAAYIINTDLRREGSGEHWVALFIRDRQSGSIYFDSYGTAPLQPLYKWLKKQHLTPVIYNQKWLQAPTSRACGAYCLYFLRGMARGLTLERILAQFQEQDFARNEALVRAQFAGY